MLLNNKLLGKKKYFNFKDLDNRLRSKNVYKNFFLYIVGILIGAIAVSVLYDRYGIITAGSTGIAILLKKIVDVDLSLMILFVCSLCLILGFAVFGIEYGSKNILITLLTPIFVKASTLLNHIIDFENVSFFLLVILAGFLSGLSTGLVRKSGYSQGGLGVFYDIVSRMFKISVGKASLICNTIIMVFCLYMFGLTDFIYGYITLYVSTFITDRILIGISNNKAFFIVTKKPKIVREYIVNNLKYNVTIIDAKGGFTNKKRKMLMCVIPTIDYIKLKDIVKEIDEDVFFLITDSYYVSK